MDAAFGAGFRCWFYRLGGDTQGHFVVPISRDRGSAVAGRGPLGGSCRRTRYSVVRSGGTGVSARRRIGAGGNRTRDDRSRWGIERARRPRTCKRPRKVSGANLRVGIVPPSGVHCGRNARTSQLPVSLGVSASSGRGFAPTAWANHSNCAGNHLSPQARHRASTISPSSRTNTIAGNWTVCPSFSR